MKNKIFLFLFLGNFLIAEVLKFSTAYEFSLQNSHAIKASDYNYKSLKSQIRRDKSFMFPRLNFNASFGYSRREYKVNKRIYKDDDIRKGIVKSFGITLSQTIYDRQRYKIYESSIIKANKAKIENQLERFKFSTKVLEVYMNILKTYTKIDLYKTYIKYHKSILKYNEKSYKMGLIGKVDILKERVQYDRMKIGLKSEKRNLRIFREQLSRYLGFSNFKLPKLNIRKFNKQVIRKMLQVVNDKDNIYNNLEYQIASINVSYLKKELEVAKSGHYPTLTLNASYNRYYGKHITIEKDYEASLDLRLPVYDGGYTRASIEKAKYDLLASKENLKELEDKIYITYKQSLSDFKANLDTLKINRDSYYVTKKNLDKIQKGFNKGLNSIGELYKAKSDMLSVKVDYLESVYKLLDNYINILILTNRFDKLNIIDKVL